MKKVILITLAAVLVLTGCGKKKSLTEQLTENFLGELSKAADELAKIEDLTISGEGSKWPKNEANFLPEPKGTINYVAALPMAFSANISDMSHADAKNYFQSLKGMTEYPAQLILKEKSIMYTGYIKDSYVLYTWNSSGNGSINRIVKKFDPASSDYSYVVYGGEEAFWPAEQMGEIPQPKGLVITDVSVPTGSEKGISMMFTGGSLEDIQSYYDKLTAMGFQDIVPPNKGTNDFTFDVRGKGKSITFSWSASFITSMEVR